jgi:hypothetical protein
VDMVVSHPRFGPAGLFQRYVHTLDTDTQKSALFYL